MKKQNITLILLIFSILIGLSTNAFAQSLEYGKKLVNEGMKLIDKGDYKKALENFEEALKIFRENNDERNIGLALTNIGAVYTYLGDYPKALEYYNKALEIDRKTKDVTGENVDVGNIGNIYTYLGDYPKALEYYNKALEIARKIGDVKGESIDLGNIGSVYFELSNYPKAFEYYNKALEIARKIEYIKGESIDLENIGNIYLELGDYSKALEYYNKALEIARKVGDINGEGRRLENIGVVYHNLGDYPKAFEYYNKALEIARKIGDVNGEGSRLEKIGVIHFELGNYPKAFEYYNKALEINKKIGVPYNGIEGNIGDVYLSQGKLKEAYEIFNKLNHNIRLGRYYLITKNYGRAKEQFSKYLAKNEKQKNAEILLSNYIGLGLSEEGLKNYNEAEKYYKKAVDFIEDQRDGLSETERKNFFQAKIMGFNRLAPYEGLARIYHYLNRNDEGFLYAENTKARLLSEEIARKYEGTDCIIPLELANKEKDLSSNITSIYKQMDSAYKKNNQERITELETKLKLLEVEKENFITNLRESYPEYASIMYPKPLKLEEIKLNPDEILIEYEVTYKETIAWIIKNGQIIKTITIPISREELTKIIRDYRESFEAISNSSDLANIKLDTGKKLYDLLLKDLVTDIKTKHIIIIPDEILGILPFETLITEIPADIKMTQGKYVPYPEGIKYAGDQFSINYYQSASALTMLRTLNKTRENRGIFAVGDPVFSSSDERLTGQAQNKPQKLTEFTIALQSAVTKDGFIKFIRLPITGELLQGLNSLFPEEIQSFTGLDASEKNIKSKNLQDYKYLVFATHGILDNDVPYIQEPALALCQVNNQDEDGFLTMNEVMSMKLSADVAVLSACKTGLGRNVSGEGVMGMGRAFQYAGAKSVIMSLWSVESKSTNIMIEKYFEYLKQGKSNTEALREARTYIRKEGYEHPFFWGPFIVVGE